MSSTDAKPASPIARCDFCRGHGYVIVRGSYGQREQEMCEDCGGRGAIEVAATRNAGMTTLEIMDACNAIRAAAKGTPAVEI